MNIAEAITLLRKVKAHCPSQLIDEYTPEAWAEVLEKVSFADANEAVVLICRQPLALGKTRYIEPGHIIGEVHRVRQMRLRYYGDVTIPDDLPDSKFHAFSIAVSRMAGDGTLTRADPNPTYADMEQAVAAIEEEQRRTEERLDARRAESRIASVGWKVEN